MAIKPSRQFVERRVSLKEQKELADIQKVQAQTYQIRLNNAEKIQESMFPNYSYKKPV